MIKTAIRFGKYMVMVFDAMGEQLPQYQGRYERVHQDIMRDASAETVFALGFTADGQLRQVPRAEW